jgi:predicted nucleic acid-binding protein
MSLVVDASVAAKWILAEPDTERALALRERAEFEGVSLLAPEILTVEVANVICKRVIRGQLEPAEGERLFATFALMAPTLVHIGGLVRQALHLSLRFRRSVYDGLYVALAIERSCDLVTADERLYNALKGPVPQLRLLRDRA